MVRKYSKGIYTKYDSKKLKEAVEAYRSGSLTLRKAARIYGVPRSTISDHALGKVLPGAVAGGYECSLFCSIIYALFHLFC